MIQATLRYIPTESLIQHEWTAHGSCGLSAADYFAACAFRTSCYRSGELEEIRVCLNKDLSPRACGPSAGECPAAQVTLLPVR